MQFKGSPAIEEFWDLLKTESPRGLAIVLAAYFDEKLGLLLRKKRGDFCGRIELGFAAGLLTPNEHDDLHVMRELRNIFAHKLRENTFDADKSRQIDQLKTWQFARQNRPELAEDFTTAQERLLYVAAAFYLRLNKGRRPHAPLPEPAIDDPDAWPIVSTR